MSHKSTISELFPVDMERAYKFLVILKRVILNENSFLNEQKAILVELT